MTEQIIIIIIHAQAIADKKTGSVFYYKQFIRHQRLDIISHLMYIYNVFI